MHHNNNGRVTLMYMKFVAGGVFASLCAAPLTASALEIYGKAHLSADIVDAGAGTHAALSSNSSRIGFKGTEDISGTKVVWKFESEIDVTGEKNSENTTGLKARNRYAGIAGEYGTVIAGYFDTPFKDVGKLAGLMHDTIADRRAILGSGNGSNKMNIRAKNAVMYISPKIGGMELRALQSAGEDQNADGSDANPVTSVSAIYRKGDAYVAGSYEYNDAIDVSGARIGAGVLLGGFNINAMYENLNSDTKAEFDRPAYGVSAAYSVGDFVLKAQAYLADDYEGSQDTGGKHFGVGAFRKLAKTTEVYAVFAMTQNEDNAKFVLAGSGHGDKYTPDQPGDDPYGASVGFIYKF